MRGYGLWDRRGMRGRRGGGRMRVSGWSDLRAMGGEKGREW